MFIVTEYAALSLRNQKVIFLFLYQSICSGYSLNLFFWAQKQMLKLMGQKTYTILRSKIV